MPDVSFTLKTFGLEPTHALRANVVFTPSRSGAIGPDGLLVRRVVVPFSAINHETGRGVVVLAQTTRLTPRTHFWVSVEWLDGSPEGWAELRLPMPVPATGGRLEDLVEIPTGQEASAIWWVDPFAPAAGDKTILWMNNATGDYFEWVD